MPNYEHLSGELKARINEDRKTGKNREFAFDSKNAVRRYENGNCAFSLFDTPFLQDIFAILHCPFYNRYADKTQVFALYKNDDITRRSLHVQLVSKIARTIGITLGLNLELIEAIALGHDIGHPPFAHTGECYLDELSMEHINRHFSHNIHSVRVLDRIFPYNLTLQTLHGIASHNGEIELEKYTTRPQTDFETFDIEMEKSYLDRAYGDNLIPATMEASVVRISDVIAYLGKDRQDAIRTKSLKDSDFTCRKLGVTDDEIVNNLIVNIIENSYGKPHISMDREHFNALAAAKEENYELIYLNRDKEAALNSTIKPMMSRIYDKLLSDLVTGRKSSPVFTHHIAYINRSNGDKIRHYEEAETPDNIVIDYIASMTDDYFIDLYNFLFPKSKIHVTYKGYFD